MVVFICELIFTLTELFCRVFVIKSNLPLSLKGTLGAGGSLIKV